ncbi:MAG: AAA family ATPase, partial [Lachnospiraceae bacterium]|nr:AAA family ATPase [Lachnospiraceae bacterium]
MNRITIKSEELSYEMNEEIKLLRTNLQFCRDDRKVILVTSSIGGEGKSTITLNLAKSLAQIKKKVLLIDADLRKSVLISKLENSVNLKGLSHFLSGQINIGEVIYAT